MKKEKKKKREQENRKRQQGSFALRITCRCRILFWFSRESQSNRRVSLFLSRLAVQSKLAGARLQTDTGATRRESFTLAHARVRIV